jgi:hypothetical protein
VATLAGCGGGDGDGGEDGSAGDDGSGDGDAGQSTAEAQGAAGDTAPALGESVSFPESYAMTATMSADGQTMEMAGRFHGGDVYWEIDQQGQQMEWYLVDGASYVVTGGQCFTGSTQMAVGAEQAHPDQFPENAQAHPNVEPAGTETIEGDEVLVYEISAADGGSETLTYYVLADSGYPRRIESESMQWDFHSWGEVDPIEAPEGNCQEMPGGG